MYLCQFSCTMQDYPDEINQWIEQRLNPEKLLNRSRKILTRSRPVNGKYRARPIWNWAAIFGEYLNGKLWGVDVSTRDAFKDPRYGGLWPRAPPKRLCRVGHVPFGFDKRDGIKSWVRPFSWRDRIDFGLCSWDDWGLER